MDKFERVLRVHLGRVRAAARAIAAVKAGELLSPETLKLLEDEFIAGAEELVSALDHAARIGTLSHETASELKDRFLRQN